ncbi:hypothetical protein CULCOIPH002_02090 [Corynebacterium ulcerans]|uniref:Uncharacterized protein n=1 Tax=Corynebacterium ulcerans TaxID=65058 RepID=A0ABD0BLI7_CORUL|nr:hypothetical protein CULCOIPH001_15520 [Corynebacterium ulcerans]GJJ35297.1 hypothetical protein CULCOIPH002_02090 [Corynebacterium ulcerans]GJJ38268.1 hypothetical protein CULCOIPH003_08990 [Corynebacterium ulcerans]GJJ41272.1 hypothetical protein CULCOIPH004_16830 [Corynebacterium ulcerans]GJJ42808.1 hypothetical protein CULCOIPH005_09970 [Corynebacterium ulcerans]
MRGTAESVSSTTLPIYLIAAFFAMHEMYFCAMGCDAAEFIVDKRGYGFRVKMLNRGKVPNLFDPAVAVFMVHSFHLRLVLYRCF